MLSHAQKKQIVKCSQRFESRFEGEREDCLNYIVTVDEVSISMCELQTKEQ